MYDTCLTSSNCSAVTALELVCKGAPALAYCERTCCLYMYANIYSLISGLSWAAEPEKGKNALGSLLGGGKRAAKEARKSGKQVCCPSAFTSLS